MTLEETAEILRRIEKYASPEPNTGCWLWLGDCRRKGYGRFEFFGHSIAAHRASWLVHRGDIPGGIWVLHRCDQPACVNPEHLFLGTGDDNVRDRNAKGRTACGIRQAAAKLNDHIVVGIREAVAGGESTRSVARRLGVNQKLISQIARRVRWRHVA